MEKLNCPEKNSEIIPLCLHSLLMIVVLIIYVFSSLDFAFCFIFQHFNFNSQFLIIIIVEFPFSNECFLYISQKSIAYEHVYFSILVPSQCVLMPLPLYLNCCIF